MKILLIRPPRAPKTITIGEFMFCEPIGLEAIYGVLEAQHDVRIVDMMVERICLNDYLLDFRPDAVGITSLCIDVENVLNIARLVKKTDAAIPVIVGGTQAQVAPHSFDSDCIDYIFTHVTAACLLRLFGSIAEKTESGDIPGLQCPRRGFTKEEQLTKNEYLLPNRESTRRYRAQYSYFGYRPCAILQTSQGCSKCCKFCLRWRIEGAKEVHQDMEIIFEQLLSIREKSIMIIDNDFLCDGSRLDALCDFLEEKKLHRNFICYGSVHSILQNQKSVERFARYGLKAVMVGYESFNPEELAGYNKKASVEDNVRVSRLLRENSVDVWASFIMHPDWDHKDFGIFRKYIRKLGPEISSLTPLTPFPGLPYFEKYRDRLLFAEHEYEKWSFSLVSIRPSQMSVKAYYGEVLKTNLYINLFMNNAVYLVKKFGFTTLFRISWGSIKLGARYILCMLRAGV